MRAVVQRVSHACVRVDDRIVGEIGAGLLALVSVGSDDDERDARSMAEKIVELRIFPDDGGLMNRSVERWFSQPTSELREDSTRVVLEMEHYAASYARLEA